MIARGRASWRRLDVRVALYAGTLFGMAAAAVAFLAGFLWLAPR